MEMLEKISQDQDNLLEQYRERIENTPRAYLDESESYFAEQVEALEEIGELEGEAGEYAHYLLAMKDKNTREYKYTPKEILRKLATELEK